MGYDALDRLTSVSSGVENESYMYDADGNRLSQNVNGISTTYQMDAASNRLLSRSSGGTTTNYKYDTEGDVFGYGPGTPSQMFYYTGFDRLNGTYIGGVSTHFNVNPEGQRLRKYTSTTNTYFAPDMDGKPLAEDINGTWYDYVWLNGRMVEVIANGGVFSLHDDQTGRPQVMTEPNGTSIDWSAQNKPFDRTVTTNAWGPFNIGFPGQYYDSEDSLWYNGHRDYDATLGRYIESDPAGRAGGVNSYAYVSNDPIIGIDPYGLCDKKITCETILPDGTTIGGRVAALSNQINSSQMASTPYGPVLSSSALPSSVVSQVYSGTNFKIMFRGQADAAFLGDAGNFAYGAVAADIGIPQSMTEMVAGAYSMAAHPSSDWVGPYNMDPSATANVPAGYAAQCLNP